MNIRTIRTIDPATSTAPKLVYLLQVIGSWFMSIPYYNLSIFRYETNYGRPLFHKTILSSPEP
jgi:hypothetical protein